MKKSAAATIVAAAALVGGMNLTADAANRRPAPAAEATINSTLGGAPAVWSEGAIVAAVVSGDVSVAISQSEVNDGMAIVMANLDLPTGFAWSEGEWAPVVISNEGDGTTASCGDPANFVFSYTTDTITVKGINCTDTDGDSDVEFTLAVEGAELLTEMDVAGDYAVSSQYRTNSSRKVKEYSWVTSNPLAISLVTPEA